MENKTVSRFISVLILSAAMLVLINVALCICIACLFDEEFEPLYFIAQTANALLLMLNIAHSAVKSGTKAAKNTMAGVFLFLIAAAIGLVIHSFVKETQTKFQTMLFIVPPALCLGAVFAAFPYYLRRRGEGTVPLAQVEHRDSDRLWLELGIAVLTALVTVGSFFLSALPVFDVLFYPLQFVITALLLLRHIFVIRKKP